jgi:hypothetical protein
MNTIFPLRSGTFQGFRELVCVWFHRYLQIPFAIRTVLSAVPPPPPKRTPWPESASKLYLPSDRRLSAKLVPTFADRGMLRGQRSVPLRSYSLIFRPGCFLNELLM